MYLFKPCTHAHTHKQAYTHDIQTFTSNENMWGGVFKGIGKFIKKIWLQKTIKLTLFFHLKKRIFLSKTLCFIKFA